MNPRDILQGILIMLAAAIIVFGIWLMIMGAS